MKLVVALLACVVASSAFAATYSGKKFKMTYDKATRTLEGEVWDTTRSEHTLIIKTEPAAPQPPQVPSTNEDRWKLDK